MAKKVDMIMIVHNGLDTKQNRYRLDTIDKYFLSGKQKPLGTRVKIPEVSIVLF